MSGTRLVPFRPDEGLSETTKCLQAADGIRTHDLLHGNQEPDVAPVGVRRIAEPFAPAGEVDRGHTRHAGEQPACALSVPTTTIEQKDGSCA